MSKFKVGDKVTIKGHSGEYTIVVLLEYTAYLIDKFNNKPIALITDLTLIPNETT